MIARRAVIAALLAGAASPLAAQAPDPLADRFGGPETPSRLIAATILSGGSHHEAATNTTCGTPCVASARRNAVPDVNGQRSRLSFKRCGRPPRSS